MDWGFGNPNKTATLIALIMIAVWLLGYVHRWGFWTALALFTGFGFCLILTESRGGLVALMIGGLIVLAWTPRPFPPWRLVSLLVACCALAIFAFVIHAQSRYVQEFSGEDRSVDNRLLIWEQVPTMIHDAPNGWGLGRSGDAYMQWYQPITRGEGYRTLVNSHLTWLTELDWPGRIVYVSAWAAIFIIVWPSSGQRWFSVPLGIWIAFAICASFSSVAEARSLWMIPLSALASVVTARFRYSLWPKTDVWLWGSLASSAMVAAIFLVGTLPSPPSSIHCPQPGVVTLGTASPRIWIVAPSRSVLGEHYGHEVRRGFAANTTFNETGLGIVSSLKNAPANQTLVFSGQVPSAWETLHPIRIILINPKPPSTETLQALLANPSITVIVGEFSQNEDYWSEQAQDHPNIKLQLVPGSEDYIPNWMQEIATAIKG